MQQKEFDYQGRKINYRTKGHGPLVVLLHGFAEDGTIWKNQYDLFPNNQLVIPDLPGSGSSQEIEDMSMEGMAEVVHTLTKTALSTPSSGGGVTLIGHSMGGYIALAFAEKYPEALTALGLFHSTAFADSEEKKDTRRKGIHVMREKGGFEFLKTAVPNLYSPETKERNSDLIEEHLQLSRNFSAEVLVKYYEAMMQRPDRTSVLINSSIPVLFVMGEYDTAVPMEDGLKLCHLPQLSYIHVLHHSGHMGMMEEPEKSNKILVDFVTGI